VGGQGSNALGLPIIQSLFNGNAPQVLLETGRMLISRAITVPQQLDNVLTQLDRGELNVKVTPTTAYRKQLQRIESQSKRTTRATLFTGLLISSTLFYTHGDSTLALVGFVASAASFLSILWAGE